MNLTAVSGIIVAVKVCLRQIGNNLEAKKDLSKGCQPEMVERRVR